VQRDKGQKKKETKVKVAHAILCLKHFHMQQQQQQQMFNIVAMIILGENDSSPLPLSPKEN
jgi:hypothetical protein